MALTYRSAFGLRMLLGFLGIALWASFAFPGATRAQTSAPAPNFPPRPVSLDGQPALAASPVAAAAASIVAPAPVPPSLTNNWVPLTNLPGFRATTLLLLTDGRVLVQNYGNTDWHFLTPDNTGSYVNGTWSAVGASPQKCFDTKSQALETYRPLYFASAVLPDGRVVILGGEYNFAIQGSEVWTNLGEIYDPVANTWTCLASPSGWNQLGDAMSVVLPNGTFQVGDAVGTQIATLDLTTNPPRWTVINPAGKSADRSGFNNEEGWTLLPNGTVLTTEVWNAADTTSTPALAYSSTSETWGSAGTAPDPLVLISKGGVGYHEVGPSLLRPDGTVFASGATGFNDIYNTNTGTWTSGPAFPTLVENATCNGTTFINQLEQYAPVDAPAALLPDGNLLIEVSPVDATCEWIPPSAFFEFDGSNLNQVAATPNSASNVSFNGRLLSLPTGQLLFSDATGDVEIYTATGTPNAAWVPEIANAPTAVGAGGTNFKITGTQFNGLSQAVAYGDDYQAATNYPLVRITNVATGHIFYARTHGHSTMAVATGVTPVSTYFDVPANIELGASTLVVVANGIPSASVALTVLKPGNTVLGSSANPSALGQSVMFTTTVSGTGGTPTGSVTFFDGTTSLGTGALSVAGVATFSTSSLRIGSHAITAQYGSDANFGSTTSGVVTQVVNGSATTSAVVSSRNPAQVLDSVTFTATVSASGSGGTPTGSVTFLDGNTSNDGNTVLATVTLSGGMATFTTTSLAVGTHAISAGYNGDASFDSVTSAAITQVVNAVPTMTAVVSSANPSIGASPVTFTATVTATTGAPIGTVAFLDGTTVLATVAISSGTATTGIAAFTTSSLTIGSHSITARYDGTGTFAGSTSPVLSQAVNGLSTSVALTSSVNPSQIGMAATFTATVTGSGGGTPTGTVTFFDGVNSLGPATLSGGTAILGTFSLAAGTHSITAGYLGDATFSPSTSAPVMQVVIGLTTSTALVSSINPSASGQPVTFTATVISSGGTPTGMVTFKDGSNVLGTNALNGGGVASFTTADLAGGSHAITAIYGGDSNFAVSTSNTVSQVVLKPATVVLVSSLNPSIGGQAITFTATVSGAGGTPTGFVTFWDGAGVGATSLGPAVALNGSGVATITTSSLTVGAHSIQANYGGNATFGVSSALLLSQTVSLATLAVVSTGSTVTAGQSVPINFIAYAASGSNLTFTLSCMGAPAKTTCAFSPSPVSPMPPPTGTPIQLTFGTSSSSVPPGPSNRNLWMWGLMGMLAAIATFWLVGTSQRRYVPRRRLAYGSCLVFVALAMVLVGCGPVTTTTPTYTGTPKGTATFTVTGTFGATTISTQVTVNVQ